MALDSPWMDEELRILSDQVGRFVQKELVPHAARWDKEKRVDRETWRKAGSAGLLCASIPEEYGGGGGTLAHEVVILEELGRAGLSGGFGGGIGVSCQIVAHYILAYGTEAQRRQWLPGLATGDIIGAVAMTEPGTGSDLQSVRTRAVKKNGGYIVSGQKTFISNGQNADLILVVAKTDPDGRSKGVSLVAVEPAKAEGFRRGRNLDKIGMHAQDTSELFFDDVFVPAENLLGAAEGLGFQQLMQQLAWERMTIAVNSVSAMERAVALTVQYVKERKAFGKALLEFQNTQFKLAECKTIATVARTFLDACIVRLLEGTLDPVTASMAKWWTSDNLCRIADECLQLHGGYGYMNEYPIARLWADARPSKIYGGTNEIMKMLIARSL